MLDDLIVLDFTVVDALTVVETLTVLVITELDGLTELLVGLTELLAGLIEEVVVTPVHLPYRGIHPRHCQPPRS